jgi:N-methylhydantoinase A
MPLHEEMAVRSIEDQIADRMKMDVIEAAAGMYHVINVNMAAGVREVSVKRGQDPRDFPLVVAGGAGPNHACMIALELEIPVMIVPKASSIFCAAGMLMSDLQHNFVRTHPSLLEKMDLRKFRDFFVEMENEGIRLLKTEHISKDRIEFVYSIDMRYVKQYHEVNVVVSREEIHKGKLAGIGKKFHPEHNRLYGYSLEELGTPIEVINLRLKCIGKTDKPRFLKMKSGGPDPSKAFKKKRRVYLPTKRRFQMVPVFDGDKLRYGNRIEGPALIEQVNTTTFVSPEFSAICDAYGSFTLYIKSREKEFKGRVIQ